MEKRTASDIAWEAYQANQPIDWGWIRHLKNQMSEKELLDWARLQIESVCGEGISAQKKTLAAKNLLNLLR